MIKQYLIAILDNMKQRIENDECTDDEIKSVTNIIQKDLITYTTVSDAAERLGKKPRNINDVIHRNRYGSKLKAIRKYYYNFTELLDNIPKKWL